MNTRNIFIILLILSVIFSITIVSASNMTDDTLLEDNVNIDTDLSTVNEINNYGLSDDSESTLSGTDSYTIWVDEKNVEDGNGTENNPFKSFDLACDDVASGKENVIINVVDGTYELGSHLKFNSSNVKIIGLGNNVIIKNKYNDQNHKQAFGLIPTSGNFTISNILFDGSTWTQTSLKEDWCFNIFNSRGNYVVNVDNCTFSEWRQFISDNGKDYLYPLIFNKCTFISDKMDYKVQGTLRHNLTFKDCIFKIKSSNPISSAPSLGNIVSFEDCWFGENSIPSFLIQTNGKTVFNNLPSYAEFSIDENYLGNDTYEIIGKLVRNGTSEVITGINPMEITLKVDYGGELNQTTAILKNGTFKVKYTSTSSDNKIAATLDKQSVSVEFQSINISLDSPIITFGDKQNITVTLPKQYNGIITVAVNNKTYLKEVNYEDVITVDISDVLNAGTWDVNVNFIDNETPSAHTYGFNTTTITVNKVSNYDFDATITPNTVYIGENATVTLSLPDGATGNVTIKVGENEAKTFNINDNIIINGFVTGDNVVNITFNGDNYKSQSVEKHVLASTKPTTITATNVTTDYKVAKDLVITLTSNNEVLANKTINVVVGSINENFTTDVDGKVSIDVSNLDPNTYVATISFAGDELYNSSSTTATVVVKADIKTDITIPEITAGKATTTTIKLPENATGNITLTVDGKIISVVNLTNGSATITIPELTAGKHDVVISYSGDGNYAGFSQNSTVTVKEQAKPTPAPATVKKAKQATKIVAKKKTFKAKTKVKKYTITLKTKAGKAVKKVQVTIKIGKKTYKAKTNNKGKATFKIKKLTKKAKYTATIKFKGNANYKAVTKKVKITIKK